MVGKSQTTRRRGQFGLVDVRKLTSDKDRSERQKTVFAKPAGETGFNVVVNHSLLFLLVHRAPLSISARGQSLSRSEE